MNDLAEAACISGPSLEPAFSDSTVPPYHHSSMFSSSHIVTDNLRTIGLPRIDHLLTLIRSTDAKIECNDLLYLALTYVLPADVARVCSEHLLTRFGSLGNIIAAPWARIEALQGSAGDLAGFIKTLHALILKVLREPLVERQIISSCDKLREYLKVTLAFSSVEMVRVLFLDNSNGLIKDELHSTGTVDHAPVYEREIYRRVIELDARAIILVHNHPSGNPLPSKADKEITLRLAETLVGFGALLHDHIIVSRNQFVSFRHLGLLYKRR
jgi:DNA repair protein RadC